MVTNGQPQGLSGIRSNDYGPLEPYSGRCRCGRVAAREGPWRVPPDPAEAPWATRDLMTYPLVVSVWLAEADQVTVSARQYPLRRGRVHPAVRGTGEEQYCSG
jgi:hypothetical protein